MEANGADRCHLRPESDPDRKKHAVESILFKGLSDMFKGRLSAQEGAQKLLYPRSLVLTHVHFTVLLHEATGVTELRGRGSRPGCQDTTNSVNSGTVSSEACILSSFMSLTLPIAS